MNDRRAVLVGVCKVSLPFSDPIIYSRYSQAGRYVPRASGTYELRAGKGRRIPEKCAGGSNGNAGHRTDGRTGRSGPDRRPFFWKTIWLFSWAPRHPRQLRHHDRARIHRGGVAVTGQTFYLFTLENLKQFGSLKAMGVPNGGILGMILLQALLVGGIGYGLGVGLTAIFFITTGSLTQLAGLHMTWLAYAGTGAAILIIVIATSFISARRVLVLEPAVVFRG